MRGDDGHRCCGLYDIVRILQVCRKKRMQLIPEKNTWAVVSIYLI